MKNVAFALYVLRRSRIWAVYAEGASSIVRARSFRFEGRGAWKSTEGYLVCR